MVILGISAYYHDSAAALLVDGQIVAAASEERFSRKKHDNRFPAKAVAFCIQKAGVDYKAIDYIVFYEKPFVKFERILRTHIHHAPKGLRSFIKTLPIWLKERLNMKRTLSKELNELWHCKRNWDVRFVEHHLSHAAFSYFTSGYEKAAVLVVDAVGENATTSIYKGDKGKITLIGQQSFPHSLGLLYSAFTYFLGFTVNSDEYKVMGLAPYGNIEAEQTQHFISVIENMLIDISDDGSLLLNEKYFRFMYGLRMVDDREWEKLFGIGKRDANGEINQSYMNLAAAIQSVTEQILLKLTRHAKNSTSCNQLCLSGGCALNCAAMGKIRESGIFENVYVPFAPGDDGGAIGAALYLNSLLDSFSTRALHPYLGAEYSDNDVFAILNKSSLPYNRLSDEILFEKVARSLSKGKIVGWFQGRMEFGPRALGNRSILADPRNSQMKEIVNSKVKFREAFRPFAPIVIKEKATQYFGSSDSPYMMFTTFVHHDCNAIPAVTHVDNSARVQTVSKTDNIRMYLLLKTFERLTGCPVLMNTSFNIMGEPIVCSPEDAVHTFLNSGIDILVINNYIVEK